MIITVISDLHIKSSDGSCKYLMSDEETCAFIDSLLERCDRLYLNGDIFDLWKSLLPTKKSEHREFKKISREYPRTVNKLKTNPKIIMISGNHDESLQKMMPHTNILFEDVVDGVMITHGHSDLWNRKLPYLGKLMTWFHGIVERALYRKPSDYRKISQFFKKFAFRNSTQIKYFKKVSGSKGIRGMINGHTHSPQIIRFVHKGLDLLYVNTGYTNGPYKNVTTIDTQTLEVLQSSSTVNDIARFRHNLKFGDVILSLNNENVFSGAIASVTDSDYSHGMVYIGNDRVIESTIGAQDGVQINLVDKYLDGHHNLRVLRLKDQTKVPEFVEFLKSNLGIKYSRWQIVVDFVYYTIKKIFRIDIKRNCDIEPNRTVCFELVGQGLLKIGYTFRPEVASAQTFIERTDLFDFEELIKVDQ